jgi:hypothetical protein
MGIVTSFPVVAAVNIACEVDVSVLDPAEIEASVKV